MVVNPRARSRRRFDPLSVAAAVFFLVAVGLAAAPAIKSGPASLAGLLLLTGLAGVAFIGLITLRGVGAAALDGEGELSMVLEALAEPAAICAADGALTETNAVWRGMVGAARRLPKGSAGPFAALKRARADGAAQGAIRRGERALDLRITRLPGDRFLLRGGGAGPPAAIAPAAPSDPARRGLDSFAAAAPFGAALIEGADAFEGRILEVNDALARIAGPAAAPGARLAGLIEPKSRLEAQASLRAGRPGPFEISLSADGDKAAHLYLAPSQGSVLAFLVDITDQRKMQLQLAQRNKMEAIGQLAGGVAHDFNNLLTALRLRVDELLLRHSLGDPSYESLSEIRETVVRAADLVRQLLSFSRKATIQRETVDLGEFIGNFEVLLRRLLREDVGLATDYGSNLPPVRADKAQLENAVMNLVVNARDAVHADGGGTITLRTARVSESEAVALGYGGAPMGEMALIEVADDGPGIAPEIIGNIFEPFFTTKALGEGTGLGLATVYGIVKQSEGWISVRSTPGAGAAFRIFLPAYVPPLTLEQPAAPRRSRAQPRDLSGAGKILFVEDEDAVRGIAARLLRARGYEVIEAADGEQALALAEKHAGAIDLMISDVIMPGMDGPTLLRKARRYLGAAPVMFISGYAEAEFSDLLEGESGVSFLAKPIDIKTLSERVKQQLQAV
ncbi:MAG: hybrid sensor histidine kinase/response regulator [Caulobacteraceae bacterium]